MSIVVGMTSLARIVLLPLIERILELRMRIIAKYTYHIILFSGVEKVEIGIMRSYLMIMFSSFEPYHFNI